MGLSFNFDFAGKAQKAAELARQQAAREKVAGLLGKAAAPYQMSEAELFPGENQPEAISSGLPAGTDYNQQQAAIEGLKNKGTGLLGSIQDPNEIARTQFYGGLLSQPNYENIGAQGLMNIANNQNALLKQQLTNQAASGNNTFQHENKLRQQYVNQTQDFVKVRDANRRITASAKTPTAAGDMALIFNFMKVLDPGSTVREGEFATAQNATGVPSRITNLYNNIMSGERLNPAQRSDFVNQANNLYTAQLGGLKQLEDQYTTMAKTYGLNPKNIVVDYRVKQTKTPSSDQAIPPPPPGFK